MLINTLQHLGYSEKESRIYLALIELGASPASTIARFLWENRVTIYSLLKNLLKKWIVFESKKQNIQVYSALAPDLLVEIEKNKYEQLQSSLPELLSLMNPHVRKPKITFYDGVDGLKNLIREVIKDFQKNPNTEIHGFLGAKDMDIEVENFLKTSLEKKKEKPIETPTNIILIGSHTYWYAEYCRKHYKTKIVEDGLFPMEHEIFTYGNKVAILMYHKKEVAGIIIESTSLANGIRSMFELIWKYAPDIRDKKQVL